MGTIRNAEQDRVLVWYIHHHNLRPSLSAHPIYYFVDKESGEQVKVSMLTMTNEYKKYNEENNNDEK